jgi:aryl-alcohol dehydrogenase-like predicted oxidoreductase
MIIERVAKITKKHDIKPAQVALAWLLAKPNVTDRFKLSNCVV